MRHSPKICGIALLMIVATIGTIYLVKAIQSARKQARRQAVIHLEFFEPAADATRPENSVPPDSQGNDRHKEPITPLDVAIIITVFSLLVSVFSAVWWAMKFIVRRLRLISSRPQR